MAQNVIDRIWHKGSTLVEPMLIGSIRYVMKYFDKQQTGEEVLRRFYDKGLNPPFISCSPGIGSDYYYAQAANIQKYGCLLFGGSHVPVPNYWVNKLTHFSDSVVNSRSRVLLDSQDELLKKSKRYGFDDFDSYLNYISRVKEKDLIDKMRASGVAVKDTLKYGHLSWKIPKTYDKNLIFQALEE